MIDLLKNLRMYRDGVWKKTDILLADHRIAAVEDEIACGLPQLTLRDCRGMRALPGYVDRHVHITGGGGEGGFSNEVPPLRVSAPIRAGVTTLVGVLGTDGTTRSVESLAAKTKALREEGLSTYFLTGSYEYPSPTITGSVKKDILLLDGCLGVKLAICDHRASAVTKEELMRLAAEVWQAGILKGRPAFIHFHTGTGRNGLRLLFEAVNEGDVPISCFQPTHLGPHLEEAVRFAEMGGFVDFTTGEDCSKTAKILACALDRCPAGTVTVSTDGNGSLPVWNEKKEIVGISAGKISNLHRTVLALVREQGVPLEQAILPCTENVSRALGLWPAKGRLAPGADADILLLDASDQIDTLFSLGRCLLSGGELTFREKFSDAGI
jgi:beta-aspartyl-dipeptidase (metallo-type)